MTEKKSPKRTEKIQIMLDDDELEAIDNWRFEHRLPSRAAAIRELIRRGLKMDSQLPEPPSDQPSGAFRVETDSDDT